MDNIILSGMLKDFVARHSLENDPPDRQFEQFANYCLLKTDHYDSFDFEKVGMDDCPGVDGVAVSIGGVIVEELEDAEAFTRTQFDARFIFAQAKTAARFDIGDFLKFVSTVRTFFGSEKAAVPGQLHKAFEIKQHIYERSAAKLRQLPTAELSFVYAGRFDDRNSGLIAQIEAEIRSIRELPYLFTAVTWHIYDGDAIARLYRETQNDAVVEVPFQRHVALPRIQGTQSTYLGVVKCADYVRMIKKENGDLNKGLFFENVRDFLGTHNPVNEDIARTIHNPQEHDRFAILNNGVTIVAKSVTPSGDTFRISQFQVVNGCQTSHVLFNNRRSLNDDMYLTVKLIETSDVDLSGQIIATTNSQSLVTKEAFATIRPYHRIVEDYFNAMRSSGYGYFYERRPHQYDDRHEIRQQYIVSAPSLIKSFVSTVLEEPHKVHYYYGTLLSEYNKNRDSELFSDDDYPGLYFAAHHITFRARSALLRTPNLKDWSFHLALMVRRILAPELRKGVRLNDKRFLEILARVDEGFDEVFSRAMLYLSRQQLRPNQNRFADVTAALLKGFSADFAENKLSARPHSTRSTSAFKLNDGRYIGTLEETSRQHNKAIIQYGPFRIEGEVGRGDVLDLQKGARVMFEAKTGRVTVFVLKLD